MNQILAQKREIFQVQIRRRRIQEFFQQKRYLALDFSTHIYDDDEQLKISFHNIFQLLKQNFAKMPHRYNYVKQLYEILNSIAQNRMPDCEMGAAQLRDLIEGNEDITEFARGLTYHQYLDVNSLLTEADFKTASYAIHILNVIVYLDAKLFDRDFFPEYCVVFFQKQYARIYFNKPYNTQQFIYWTSLFQESLLFFTNIISDQNLHPELVREIATNMFNSDFCKIWSWHAEVTVTSEFWKRANQLLLLILQLVRSSEGLQIGKFNEFLKLQTRFIYGRENDFEISLKILNICAIYELTPTVIITKGIWQHVLNFTPSDDSKISYFINLTSSQVKDNVIESYLIEKCEILEHLWRWLHRNKGIEITIKICQLIENILTHQNEQLVVYYIEKYNDLIFKYIDETDYEYDVCQAYISTGYQLFKYQIVSIEQLYVLLEAGYLRNLLAILSRYKRNSKKLLELLLLIDSNFQVKDIMYASISECSGVELLDSILGEEDFHNFTYLELVESVKLVMYGWSKQLDEKTY